jgi:single-strand DNA-binding protein
VYELDVDEIGPSLRYAIAKPVKQNKGGDDRGSRGRQGGTSGNDPWSAPANSKGSSFDDEPPF